MLAINSTYQINQRNKLKKSYFNKPLKYCWWKHIGRFNNAKIKLQLRANTRFYRNIEPAMVCHAYRSDLSICGRQSGGKMAAGAKRGLGSLCNLTAIPLTRKEEGKCYQFLKLTQKCVFGLAFLAGGCLSPRLHFHR